MGGTTWRGPHLHHLLAQKRPTTTLDEVEVRVHLVGAIDRNVEV